MRYYSLYIQDGGDTLNLNENNPWGINVNFEIKSFSDVRATAPTVIEILNAPLDFFTDTEKFKGKQIIFVAGIQRCPFTDNQKLIMPLNNRPLLYGQISSVYATWAATETRITLQVNSTQTNVDYLTFTLNRGDIIAVKVAEYLNQISVDYEMGLLFEVAPSALNVTLQNMTSLPYRFINDMYNVKVDIVAKAADFLRPFRLLMKQENSIITIYSEEDLSVPPGVILVDSTQLLTQPVYEGPEIASLEIGLDPRISLGSMIYINSDITLFSGSLLGDVAGAILKSATDAKILKQGYYQVLDVLHKGDSRNSSPQAWSTNVRCSFKGI